MTTVVAAERVRTLALRVLTSLGAPAAAARAQAGTLLESDLRGRPSHGMQRLPTLAARIDSGVLDPRAEPALTWRSSVALCVDGGHGFGPLSALAAVEALAPVARREGIAVAAIRRAGHIGMLAPYLERLVGHGLIGMVFTTSEALVHPVGGRRALVGTNPIGIGVPARPEPFVLDMSTAAISAGDVLAHADRGEPLPAGRAIDADGRATTDAHRALSGALSPFGGAKGYGLGVAFELLVAALTDTATGSQVHGTLDTDRLATKGDVVVALDARVTAGVSPDALAGAYLDALRDSPTAPGVDGVRVPGDRMRAERKRRLVDGIPYAEGTWSRLLTLEQATAAGADA